MELIETNNYRAKRRAVADFYKNNLPFEMLKGINYIHHRFIIFPKDKQQVLRLFNSKKILAKSVFEANTKSCIMAAKFSETALELPCHHFIDIDDLEYRLKEIL